MHLLPGSFATFLKNHIELSRASGVIVETRYGLLQTMSSPKMKNTVFISRWPQLNRLDDGRVCQKCYSSECSVYWSWGAKFRAKSKGITSFGVASAKELVLQGNIIEENEQSGIYFFSDTTVELYRNVVRKNLKTGLYVCSGACPRILDGNEIESNKEAGIILVGGSGARFSKCKMQKNDPANFLLQPQSGGTIEDCDLGETTSDGINK